MLSSFRDYDSAGVEGSEFASGCRQQRFVVLIRAVVNRHAAEPAQQMPNEFSNARAVVTGSSSGIGRATALALAAAGCDRQVVHCRSRVDAARQTASRIGQDVPIIAADLAVAEDRQRLVDEAFDHLQTPTTWIFNAGADVLTGPAAEWSFQQKLETLWRVDVAGTIDLARRVAERLSGQTRSNDEPPPSMTFIGWDQAPRGMEGQAGQMFGPIKAAVMAFAMSLAQELAPRIRVNVVAPGWIQTAWGETTEGYWDRRARDQSLMGRWGKPADVAAAILYAANPQNTFVTGQIIEVNGGWNRRYE